MAKDPDMDKGFKSYPISQDWSKQQLVKHLKKTYPGMPMAKAREAHNKQFNAKMDAKEKERKKNLIAEHEADHWG